HFPAPRMQQVPGSTWRVAAPLVAYIQELVGELLARLGSEDFGGEVESQVQVIAQELDRLDPRDFVPAARAAFVHARRRTHRLGGLADSLVRLEHGGEDRTRWEGGVRPCQGDARSAGVAQRECGERVAC